MGWKWFANEYTLKKCYCFPLWPMPRPKDYELQEGRLYGLLTIASLHLAQVCSWLSMSMKLTDWDFRRKG